MLSTSAPQLLFQRFISETTHSFVKMLELHRGGGEQPQIANKISAALKLPLVVPLHSLPPDKGFG